MPPPFIVEAPRARLVRGRIRSGELEEVGRCTWSSGRTSSDPEFDESLRPPAGARYRHRHAHRATSVTSRWPGPVCRGGQPVEKILTSSGRAAQALLDAPGSRTRPSVRSRCRRRHRRAGGPAGPDPFFEGGGTFADKRRGSTSSSEPLAGDEHAEQRGAGLRRPIRPQAVREVAELEGVIGAEYARVAVRGRRMCRDRRALPARWGRRPLPPRRRAAAVRRGRYDTLTCRSARAPPARLRVTLNGLRRAAIGLCRLAVEGGVPVSHELRTRRPGVVEEPRRATLTSPSSCCAALRSSSRTSALSRPRRSSSRGRTSPPCTRSTTRAAASSVTAADDEPIDDTLLKAGGKQLAEAVRAEPTPAHRRSSCSSGRYSLPRRCDVLRRRARDGPGRAREGEPPASPARRAPRGRRLGDLSQIPLEASAGTRGPANRPRRVGALRRRLEHVATSRRASYWPICDPSRLVDLVEPCAGSGRANSPSVSVAICSTSHGSRRHEDRARDAVPIERHLPVRRPEG